MTERVVRTTATADAQVRVIHAWWVENRTAAPNLFASEFAHAVSLLASAPLIGKRYQGSGVRGVRRYLLRATRCHVYYIVSGDEILLLSVWGAVRGTTPDLKAILATDQDR